jgi:hypothetical protein
MADVAGESEADPYGGIQVASDVAPADGVETVLASHRDGVMVLDENGTVIARASGHPAEGSADEIVALAVGEGPEGALIVVASTSGGHRTSETSLTFYRVGDNRLEPVFSGIVEAHDAGQTLTGALAFARDALIYRAPGGVATLWTYDRALHRYMQRASAPAA